MKKLTCLLLVMVLLIAAGCDNSVSETDSTANTEQSQETTTDTTSDTTTAENETTETTIANTETTATENGAANTTATDGNEQSSNNQSTQQTPTQSTTATCSHSKTSVKNTTAATCTTAGYTGDTFCNDCGKTVSTGSSVPATGHTKTELRNQKDATISAEGYTGDTVCIACGTIVSKGNSIPQLTTGKVTYTLPNGTSYTVDEDVNITDYTMKLNTKSASHTYYDAERAILSYFNKVRSENGLSKLSWNEDAYCFVKTRAKEYAQFHSHTRPNGTDWETVYSDGNVYLLGYYSEICATAVNCDENFIKNDADDLASFLVETSWMNSSSHRATILSSKAKTVSISVYLFSDGTCYAVANFFNY